MIYVVGDVHGCIETLLQLLARLQPQATDSFTFLGDLVNKGPESAAVLDLVETLVRTYPNSVAICGNHEEKILRYRDRDDKEPGHLVASVVEGKLEPFVLHLKPRNWDFMEQMPLLVRPASGVLCVHGGVYPAFFERFGPIGDVGADWRKEKSKRAEYIRRFLRVRKVSPKGQMVALDQETPDDVHWTSVYDGCEGTVYYGHDPRKDVRQVGPGPTAVGLDTGAVFGGRLTAAVLDSTTGKLVDYVSVKGEKCKEWRT